MLELAQNQGPQLCQGEAELIAAEAGWAPAGSSTQSLTASESALQGEIGQFARHVEELENELARMHHDYDLEKTLQLSGIRNSLTASFERFEQHLGRLTPSHLRFESFLSTLISRLVDEVTGLISDEVVPHRARVTSVVSSASYILNSDLQSVVELLHTVEQGYGVSTASPETSGTPPPMLLVSGND